MSVPHLIRMAVIAASLCSCTTATGSPSETPDRSSSSPPPEAMPPAAIPVDHVNEEVGFILGSPSSDEVEPAVDSHEALNAAWSEGVPGEASAVVETYGLLTWGEAYQEQPVWIVSFLDVCQLPSLGGVVVPLGSPGPETVDLPTVCTSRPFNTVIDATSGEFLFSYSDGSSPR